MPTSPNVQHTTQSHSVLWRTFRVVRKRHLGVDNSHLWDCFCRRALPFAGAVLLLTANGCIATRGWVNDQLNPINARLNNTDAKADQALAGLQNLHLEKRLVLD